MLRLNSRAMPSARRGTADSHMQIIAGAGSRKIEVAAQRVVDLLAARAPAESIVAFTFTERAAEELQMRIARPVEDRLGR